MEAAKYLNKDEYEYFRKNNEIPFPFILSENFSLKIVYCKGKLIERKYF
jgi:hypothetical protein